MPRAPTVMLEPGSWEELCEGLISKNICEVWPLEELFHWQGQPLVNGLFAVGKGEYIGAVETQRLIMNLTPLNALTQSLKGDVGTLPGLSGFSGFFLEDGEVAVLSSEDIKCFSYLFAVPQAWKPFLGFNRDVPSTLVPERLLDGGVCWYRVFSQWDLPTPLQLRNTFIGMLYAGVLRECRHQLGVKVS